MKTFLKMARILYRVRTCSVTIVGSSIIIPLIVAAIIMYLSWSPDNTFHGIADLRRDFSSDKTYSLRGQWECYPGKLLKPGEFVGVMPKYVQIPVEIKDAFRSNRYFGSKSVATYRLRLLLPAGATRMALITYMIRSADRIFINGEQVLEQGRVTKDFNQFSAFNRPEKCYFKNNEDNEIIIQVANNDVGEAGIISPPSVGTERQTSYLRRIEVFSDAVIVVSCLIIFCIFFGIFFRLARRWELMYFGLFCLSMFILYSLVNEKIAYDVFDNLDYDFAIRVIMWTTVSAGTFYSQYMLSMLNAPRRIANIGSILSTIIFLYGCLAPMILLSSLITMYLVFAWGLFLSGAMLFYAVTNLSSRSYGVWYQLFGMSSAMTLLIISFIHSVGYINAVRTVVVILPLLLISQFLFIAGRARKLEIEKSVLASEMRSLRSQMNPHFVYNTMSAIAGMMRSQPDLARKVILDFSAMFRKLVKPSRTDSCSTLSEEMELVRYYVDIEQVRFGERLSVTILNSVDNMEQITIPALIIQPLVENAIKHNLEKRGRQAIAIEIRLEIQKKCLIIEVCDNGIGMSQKEALQLSDKGGIAGGIGIRNIRDRLAMHGGKIDFVSCQDRFCARVEVQNIFDGVKHV